MPSSVGMPKPAVKLPSEPPPTAAASSSFHCELGWRQLRELFCEARRTLAVRSMGRRLMPPSISSLQRLSKGLRDRSLRSMPATCFALLIRTSISTKASAAITFVQVPPLNHARIYTDTPCRRLFIFAITSDLARQFQDGAVSPCRDRSPAWAATPCTRNLYSPTPLRAVFTAPRSPAAGSKTSTPADCFARAWVVFREEWLPTSSSETRNTVTGHGSSPCAKAFKRFEGVQHERNS